MGMVINNHSGLVYTRTLTIFPNFARAFMIITIRIPSSSSP